MIINFNEYIKENQTDNNFYLKFVFNKTNNNFLIYYEINFDKYIIYKKRGIHEFIAKLVDNILKKIFEKINIDSKYIVLTEKEAIYFLSFLISNNLDVYCNDNLEKYFISKKSKFNNRNDLITSVNPMDYEKFKNTFKNLSFKQKDIDNHFINIIEKNNKLYFNKIYRLAFSNKIKDMFKYLEDSKNFDLI